MKLLVSACLLGVACRYDGRSKLHPLAQELCRRHEVIPVCGEIFGGLPTPRLPSEPVSYTHLTLPTICSV